MAASERSNKDKAMASYMKLHKIERRTGNCPMCHNLIGLPSMYNHIVKCRAGAGN